MERSSSEDSARVTVATRTKKGNRPAYGLDELQAGGQLAHERAIRANKSRNGCGPERTGAAPRVWVGHPATTETIDYTTEDLEFMKAIEEFQAQTGRKFPTWKETLAVIKSMGYVIPDDVP